MNGMSDLFHITIPTGSTCLILTVNSALNPAALNERNYLFLNLVDGPAKCGAHSVETNGLEWLEVKHNRDITNEVRQIIYMQVHMNVHIMARLVQERRLRIINVDRCKQHTEYRSRSSRTFLKSLERYDWIKSRTYGSCSIYAEKIAFPVS